jgi:hypothetical protein
MLETPLHRALAPGHDALELLFLLVVRLVLLPIRVLALHAGDEVHHQRIAERRQ